MSLPHVLLGLLSRAPASGWDLKSRLARDPALGWDAELAQIYPALRKLLRGGFVSSKRRRSTKGPARREYAITPAGRREFLSWVDEPIAPPREKDAALARLAFLERQSVETRIERLRLYRGALAEALKRASPGSSAARRRRRALLETELAWADAEVVLLSAQRESAAARETRTASAAGRRPTPPFRPASAG